ncbi:hypothetical protein CBR_g50838 [Chara braunii]|uniref:Uncharacterized protein n=1 Tax=Chara braunii TaxID=69332 RepID=A0A388M7Q6_CHABU|nr:hypothetical protein CBR_g50838 [Chara braunii]|eukprot:GBG90492.1 hypothetical protein CBR_g50838 [Chara braunii]
MLREDYEWLLEEEADVVERLGKAEGGQRRGDETRRLKVSIREFHDRVKEKTELLTRGVASHIPKILKEIRRLRKREENRDVQLEVEKMGKEVESLKTEVSKVREEQKALKQQIESLSVALSNKDKEEEKKRVEQERLEKEVGKLEGKIGEQEKEMESEKEGKKEEGKKLEERWKEMVKRVKSLKMVSQGGGAEAPTKVIEWKGELRFEIKSVRGHF